MLTLIMREIEDNRVFFIIAISLAFFFSIIISYKFYYYPSLSEESVTTVAWANSIVEILILCGIGSSQMYSDKTKKISALLATLAVTRSRIFIARVASGILAVAAGLLPVIATTAIVSSMVEPQTPVYRIYLIGEWIPIILFCFAGYCIGLQAGWTSNKTASSIGPVLLSLILIGLLLIKGFGPDLYFILVLLIVCCLFRAWRTYSRAAL